METETTVITPILQISGYNNEAPEFEDPLDAWI